MRVRMSLVLALTLVAGVTALSATAQEFPEGTRPSDNMFTRSAQLYLAQAQTNPNPEERTQRFNEALQAALQSVEEDAGNPRGYFQAGQAYIGLGDALKAAEMFDRAEELYPAYVLETDPIRENHWVGLYNRTINLMNSGDYQGAAEGFEQANAIFDKRPEAMLNLGAVFAQLGQPDQAAAAYEQALELMRGPAFEEQTPETQENWRNNTEIAAFNVAQIYAQNNEPGKAVEAYTLYLENDPDNISALSNLAVVLVQMEQPDSARSIYNRILTMDGLDARELFVAGVGLYQIESYPEASEAFARSLELNPRSRDAAYNRAQTLFLSENWEPLGPAGDALLELDPRGANGFIFAYQGYNNTADTARAQELALGMNDLTYSIANTVLQPRQGGGATLLGEIEGRAGAPVGESVVLLFHFTGVDGSELVSQEITLAVPAEDEATDFDMSVESEEILIGYWYEVVSEPETSTEAGGAGG